MIVEREFQQRRSSALRKSEETRGRVSEMVARTPTGARSLRRRRTAPSARPETAAPVGSRAEGGTRSAASSAGRPTRPTQPSIHFLKLLTKLRVERRLVEALHLFFIANTKNHMRHRSCSHCLLYGMSMEAMRTRPRGCRGTVLRQTVPHNELQNAARPLRPADAGRPSTCPLFSRLPSLWTEKMPMVPVPALSV